MKALSPRPRKAKLKKPAQKTEEKLTCFAENGELALLPARLVNVRLRHVGSSTADEGERGEVVDVC